MEQAARKRSPPRLRLYNARGAVSACGAAKRWVAVPRPCDPIPLPTALVDITGNDGPALERAWEETLGEGLERGWIGDAVIAASLGQAERLWRLATAWPSCGRTSPPFPGSANSALRTTLGAHWPERRADDSGQLGDGKLHIIVGANTLPETTTACDVEAALFAEHGIGTLRKILPRLLPQCGGDRRHARRQTCARPKRHHESGHKMSDGRDPWERGLRGPAARMAAPPGKRAAMPSAETLQRSGRIHIIKNEDRSPSYSF